MVPAAVTRNVFTFQWLKTPIGIITDIRNIYLHTQVHKFLIVPW